MVLRNKLKLLERRLSRSSRLMHIMTIVIISVTIISPAP